MSIPRFLYVLMIIFVFAASVFVSPILANSNQETASLVITAAEEGIILTYGAVLEAEQAGGNVTGLFAQLNEAGEFLAAARMSFRNGDFDKATLFANLSENIAEEVRNSAIELKDLAWNEGMQRTLFAMLGSIFGVISVILGSLWVWRFLKSRYQ